MTTLEKLCRAACEADGENPDAFHTKAALDAAARNEWPVTDHAIPLWLGYRKQVLAVLTALEDPSDEMVEEGIKQLEECTFDWTSAAPCGAGHVFAAMIRKAKEG